MYIMKLTDLRQLLQSIWILKGKLFMMKLCQMFKGAFICLPAVVFNLAHRGLRYLAFIFVFVTCVLGDIFFFSQSPYFHLFQGFK